MKLRIKLNLWLVSILLFITPAVFCQPPQSTSNQPPVRPINMLVLGDSIMWGQGLKPSHKPSYHVKVWLEKTTGRSVIERIEAHSGAGIEGDSIIDIRTSTDREVNLGLPSKSAILILPMLSPPLGDRGFGDLIFASDLRLRLASLDFANDFEFEFAGECSPLDHCGPRRYCALLRHR